mgnify:CR=1 FL=1
MDVSGITNTASQSGIASKSLAGNFDTFLKLLTAQLQNQDPLEPMDTSEFTRQLVQYSSVEQGIYTNKNLETLIGLQQSSGLGTAMSYLGRTVTAANDEAALADGEASWTYNLPRAAASVALTVKDADGKTVFPGTGPTTAGDTTVVWDGSTSGGGTAPPGIYSLTVTAADSTGAELTSPVRLTGRVSGVETVNGSVVLNVNGVRIALSDITSVSETVVAGDGDTAG